MITYMVSALKEFASIHVKVDIERNRCIEETDILQWMTTGKTILIQKDPQKGTDLNNYWPIKRQQMMWKILIVQIREEIY